MTFHIGATLGGGRFRIVEWIRGGPEVGQYLASGPSGRCLVTLSPRLTKTYSTVSSTLELPFSGVATLQYVGPLEIDRPADAIIEAMPAGSAAVSGMTTDVAARLGLAVAQVVSVAHFFGRALGSIRPELIFAAPHEPESPTLTPRCDPYLALARPALEGHGLLFDRIFAAPEILRGGAHSIASDVFAFGATLASWLGHYPFGDSIPQQFDSIVRGDPQLHGVDPVIAPVLAKALKADPGHRGTMQEFCTALEIMVARHP